MVKVKNRVLIFLFLLPIASFALDKLTATPRMVSGEGMAYFTEVGGSYQISTTSGNYNRIMNALSVGIRKKLPVNLLVNGPKRIIEDVDMPPEKHDTTMYEDDAPVVKKDDPAAGGKAQLHQMPAGFESFMTPSAPKPQSGYKD